ncbi:MAG: hypothetical protein ACW98U_06905 [Candidatus Thorarchaeota archaeon]|jgi:hypothetical protein
MEADELCRYHLEALNNLRAAYDGWNTASGVSWNEYLEQLEQIDETGRWIIDVIEYVRQQDGP